MKADMPALMAGAVPCVAAFLLSAGSSPAEPVTLACAPPHITAMADEPTGARAACAAAGAADARLRELGLSNDKPLLIEVTGALDAAPDHCVALYRCEAGVVQVLPEDRLAGNPGRLGPFPDLPAAVYFDSLVAHELAHAYVDRSAGERFVPRIAHEYLAYAVQLDLMPEEARARILADAGVGAPVALAEFNEATLGFAPLRFAALAWLHFRDAGGDAAAVRGVISGDVSFYSLRE